MKSHRGRITNKKAFRVAARRYLQVRAEELKNLEEKRAALVEEMEGILNKAQEEERAFEESEQTRFDEIEKEINAIDKTIEAKERARNLGNPGGKKKEDGENDDLTVEERAFVDYVRGTLTNERAANLTYADNGAVIPSSIVNKIIEKVVEICPIYIVWLIGITLVERSISHIMTKKLVPLKWLMRMSLQNLPVHLEHSRVFHLVDSLQEH